MKKNILFVSLIIILSLTKNEMVFSQNCQFINYEQLEQLYNEIIKKGANNDLIYTIRVYPKGIKEKVYKKFVRKKELIVKECEKDTWRCKDAIYTDYHDTHLELVIIDFKFILNSDMQKFNEQMNAKIKAENEKIAEEKRIQQLEQEKRLKRDQLEQEKRLKRYQFLENAYDVVENIRFGSDDPYSKCFYNNNTYYRFINNLTNGEKFILDTLYKRHKKIVKEDEYDMLDDIAYIGEIKQKVEKGYNNKSVFIANRKHGYGIAYFEDGKVEGNWIDGFWDRKSKGTVYYLNGTQKTGFFVPSNLKNRIFTDVDYSYTIYRSTSEWIFLGETSAEAEIAFQKLLNERKQSLIEEKNNLKQQIYEMNSFIDNNQYSILSKVKSEKKVLDNGTYIRYEFQFSDGASGKLDYYPNNGEWCTFSGFVIETNDNCYKSKGKALCRIYWNYNH